VAFFSGAFFSAAGLVGVAFFAGAFFAAAGFAGVAFFAGAFFATAGLAGVAFFAGAFFAAAGFAGAAFFSGAFFAAAGLVAVVLAGAFLVVVLADAVFFTVAVFLAVEGDLLLLGAFAREPVPELVGFAGLIERGLSSEGQSGKWRSLPACFPFQSNRGFPVGPWGD
jgi:hypothetical protein